jgi:hypothetical protein
MTDTRKEIKMEILDFGPSGSTPKKRRNRVALVVGALALAAIGSTFAASISLNNGTSIEYGQGLQQATACDSHITLAPANTFVNATSGGAFDISSVAITDTNTTSSTTGLAGCIGKSLKLTAYGDSAATPLVQCTVPMTSGVGYSTGFTGLTVSCPTYTGGSSASIAATGSTGFTITFSGTLNTASSGISKFTLESF